MKLLYLALAAGAAAKCRKNDQCGGGEFCNVAKECEACYYPGDIGTQNPACQRYVDACGYACDGSDYPGGDPAATRGCGEKADKPARKHMATGTPDLRVPTLGVARLLVRRSATSLAAALSF